MYTIHIFKRFAIYKQLIKLRINNSNLILLRNISSKNLKNQFTQTNQVLENNQAKKLSQEGFFYNFIGLIKIYYNLTTHKSIKLTIFVSIIFLIYFFFKHDQNSYSRLIKVNSYKFGKLSFFNYKRCYIENNFIQDLNKIENFPFKQDDLLIIAYPRTGSTLLAELVWLLKNNLNFDQANKTFLNNRVPILELNLNNLFKRKEDSLLIETHFPPRILFEKNQFQKPKVITLLRDPKDVLISYYYYSKMFNLIDYDSDFRTFLDIFSFGKLPFGSIFIYFNDLFEYKENNNEILIVYFEDLINNFEEVVNKICEYLNIEKLNDVDMKKLKNHCTFESMKKNKYVNMKYWDKLELRNLNETEFLRKGVIGDYKNHLLDYQISQVDRFLKAFTRKEICDKYFDENNNDVKLYFSLKEARKLTKLSY